MTNRTLPKIIFTTGCAFAGVSVLLGAFGAHALKDLLTTTQLNSFETGVRYQFMHAITLVVLALGARKLNENVLKIVYNLFTIGIVLFSFSIYLLATSELIGEAENIKKIGFITPIGGLFLISAWGVLSIKGYEPRRHRPIVKTSA